MDIVGCGFGSALLNAGDTNQDGLADLFVGAPDCGNGEGRVARIVLSPGGFMQSFALLWPDLTAYPDLQMRDSGFGALMTVTLFDGGNTVLVAPGYVRPDSLPRVQVLSNVMIAFSSLVGQR